MIFIIIFLMIISIFVRNMEIFEKIIENLKNTGHSSDFYDLAQCYEAIKQFGNPNPYYNNFRRLYWYFKAGQSGYADHIITSDLS